jgi:hypothetical protein
MGDTNTHLIYKPNSYKQQDLQHYRGVQCAQPNTLGWHDARRAKTKNVGQEAELALRAGRAAGGATLVHFGDHRGSRG